jgi:hypothetical protein
VALTADSDGGEAITRPLSFQGRKLFLNYRAKDGGSVGVELQDADGKPLQGFSANDCLPLRGGSLAAAVAWTGNDPLASRAGQPLRIRFLLNNAELFAFHFE